MFAIYRAKLSEGIDFPDDMARVVINVGIPFPNIGDPMLQIKERYYIPFEERKKRRVECAIRAVNQAAGRVIRHERDYGCIFFVDERYAEHEFRSGLSRWIRDLVSFEDISAQKLHKDIITFMQ